MTKSEGTGSDLHEAFEREIEESDQAAASNSENLCELTRKKDQNDGLVDQNDDLVDQIQSSAPNCDMDSKAIVDRESTISNDASDQMKPSNGEQAFESNPRDASLGKQTCTSSEGSETNLNLSVNASDTPCKDVEIPACKAILPSNSEDNAPACSDLQVSHSGVGSVVETKPPIPSPEAVENVTNESEVTPMETDDAEGQNSGAGAGAFAPENGEKVDPESNQTPTSFSARYCEFGDIAVYFLNWKMVLKLNIASRAPILKV